MCRRCRNRATQWFKYCDSCRLKERERYVRRKSSPIKYARIRESNLSATRKYRLIHPERIRQFNSNWTKNNPEKDRARVNRRRARILNAFVEDIDYKFVWERDKGICGICLTPAESKNWHLDHILALSLGGKHSYDNVQVSHPRCNITKGHKERWTIKKNE